MFFCLVFCLVLRFCVFCLVFVFLNFYGWFIFCVHCIVNDEKWIIQDAVGGQDDEEV